MSTLVPTTELEAVNAMLRLIGEPPANSLASPTRLDVIQAIADLNTASRVIQGHGWYFNTEKEVLISNSGAPNFYMPLATNVLSMRVSARSLNPTTSNYIYRAGRLYDRSARTFTFAASLTVYVDQIVLVDFEELPDSARKAIYRRAAIDFQAGTAAGTTNADIAEKLAVEAWAELLQDDCEVERHQLTSGPGQFELNYRR
jgi:hypothetical protein